MKPEPVFRCESCCAWIPREPDDFDGPVCKWCLDMGAFATKHESRRLRARKMGGMWPAFRPQPFNE